MSYKNGGGGYAIVVLVDIVNYKKWKYSICTGSGFIIRITVGSSKVLSFTSSGNGHLVKE